MSGLTIAFESKGPFHTPWLSLCFPAEDEPVKLLADLKEIGWEEDLRWKRVPPISGEQEVIVSSPKGSELFGTWTDEERRARMPVVRKVLRKHGFTKVPWNKLSLEDLL